jgi:hypothetical protein
MLVNGGKILWKVGRRNSAHFNKLDHYFLGYLQGLFFQFFHIVTSKIKIRPEGGKWP